MPFRPTMQTFASAYHKGIDIKNLNSYLKTSINKVSAIYLFRLGKVKDLRTRFDIDPSYRPNHLLFKYGLTKDLRRRANEHNRSYGKLSSEFALQLHVSIDPEYLYDAESELSSYFKSNELYFQHPDFKELIIVSPQVLHKEVSHYYKLLGSKWGANIPHLF